jgi:hypothetical protein
MMPYGQHRATVRHFSLLGIRLTGEGDPRVLQRRFQFGYSLFKADHLQFTTNHGIVKQFQVSYGFMQSCIRCL